MSSQKHEGRIVLHLAVKRGSQKTIKFLISQGAEASPINWLGRTPLHLSAQMEYREAIKLLISEGALVFAVNSAERAARN